MGQRPGEAYIQKPEGCSESEETVDCFLESGRICGGACVAYDPEGVGQGYRRTSCILVNAVRQAASALSALARSGSIPGSETRPPEVTS
jgi:hypothetical protein